jgi:hypothetical protein
MQIPVLCMDYGFMRENSEEVGQESKPIMITRCRNRGPLSADMLVSKDYAYGVRRMIQLWNRSLKLAVEARIGVEILVDHLIAPWLVRHAA